jgi:hypothetical protein
MKENVREFVSSLVRGILIGSVVFVIIIGLVYLGALAQHEDNESIYNNGVCTDCGGHYNFVSAAKEKRTTYYYYQCDNCEKIIELRH